jgi:hypothetical protein
VGARGRRPARLRLLRRRRHRRRAGQERGRAAAPLEGALLLLSEDGFDALTGPTDDARCAAALAQSGRAAEIARRWPGAKLHFIERVLPAGRLVAVAGAGLYEADPDPRAQHGYRELSRRIVLRAECTGALLISDDPAIAIAPLRR